MFNCVQSYMIETLQTLKNDVVNQCKQLLSFILKENDRSSAQTIMCNYFITLVLPSKQK